MKQKKSNKQKVEKEFPEFVSEVSGLDSDALKLRLARLSLDLNEVEKSQEADEDYANSKALVKELSAPYRDAKKALKLKNKYIAELIGE